MKIYFKKSFCGIVLWVQGRTYSIPLWEVTGRKTVTERRALHSLYLSA